MGGGPRHHRGMAYRPSAIGNDVYYGDPARAAAALAALLAKHGTQQAVAEACGVDRMTVGRWLRRLAAKGHPVVGAGPLARPK